MRKGTKHTLETLEIMRLVHTGVKQSVETIEKRRLKQFGRKHKPSTKLKMRLSALGPNNHQWKGNNISYKGVHLWLQDNKPKLNYCELCGTTNKRLDLANINGVYNRDMNNYQYLCRSCHMKTDGRMLNLRKGLRNARRSS